MSSEALSIRRTRIAELDIARRALQLAQRAQPFNPQSKIGKLTWFIYLMNQDPVVLERAVAFQPLFDVERAVPFDVLTCPTLTLTSVSIVVVTAHLIALLVAHADYSGAENLSLIMVLALISP